MTKKQMPLNVNDIIVSQQHTQHQKTLATMTNDTAFEIWSGLSWQWHNCYKGHNHAVKSPWHFKNKEVRLNVSIIIVSQQHTSFNKTLATMTARKVLCHIVFFHRFQIHEERKPKWINIPTRVNFLLQTSHRKRHAEWKSSFHPYQSKRTADPLMEPVSLCVFHP